MARARYVAQASVLRGARWALVVQGAASHTMGRMAEILMEGSPVELRAFPDLPEAEAWVRETGGPPTEGDV